MLQQLLLYQKQLFLNAQRKFRTTHRHFYILCIEYMIEQNGCVEKESIYATKYKYNQVYTITRDSMFCIKGSQ